MNRGDHVIHVGCDRGHVIHLRHRRDMSFLGDCGDYLVRLGPGRGDYRVEDGYYGLVLEEIMVILVT